MGTVRFVVSLITSEDVQIYSHFYRVAYLLSSSSISSAIEVEPLFQPQFVLGSTLCFLQYEDPQLEQSLWNVRISSIAGYSTHGL